MIVEVHALNKSYGDKVVLKNLSFSVPEASIYGLVGKNGAGKTTLLNIISGISEQDSGDCIICKERIIKGHYKPGELSYLPDIPSFYDYLTVQEYVSFILSAKGKRVEGVSEDIEELYVRLGLKENVMIKSLSRGNKQKLGILAAVITKPRILILDEPTSSLDPVGRKDVMALISELRNQGMTILFSTHILNDLELVCDRIGFLHNGAIQREVALGASAHGEEAYEVFFASNEQDVNIPAFAKLLPSYQVDQAAESGKVICKPIQGLPDQSEFFSALSFTNERIISVRRVYQQNLETIMMEVLNT